MAYHDWSEEGFDWASLGKAEDDITNFCRRWARLGGQSKEKFGELRFYASFGLSLHYLLLPGYHHYGWMPKWLVWFDQSIFSPMCNKLLISGIWLKYQQLIYRIAYQRALNKYSHIAAEIGGGADFPEYFADSIVTTKDAEENGWNIVTSYSYKGTHLGSWRSHEKSDT